MKEQLIPTPRVYNVHDLASQVRNLTHWFDKDTMRFFKSRLTTNFKCLLDEEYKKVYLFVTTEKKSFSDDSRAGNIRLAVVKSIPCNDHNQHLDFNVETVGEFATMSPQQAVYKYKTLKLDDVKHLIEGL